MLCFLELNLVSNWNLCTKNINMFLSFYRNIVCRNVSCDVGLRVTFFILRALKSVHVTICSTLLECQVLFGWPQSRQHWSKWKKSGLLRDKNKRILRFSRKNNKFVLKSNKQQTLKVHKTLDFRSQSYKTLVFSHFLILDVKLERL